MVCGVSTHFNIQHSTYLKSTVAEGGVNYYGHRPTSVVKEFLLTLVSQVITSSIQASSHTGPAKSIKHTPSHSVSSSYNYYACSICCVSFIALLTCTYLLLMVDAICGGVTAYAQLYDLTDYILTCMSAGFVSKL